MYKDGGSGNCLVDKGDELFSEEEFSWHFLGPVRVLGGSPRRAPSCWLGDIGCEGSRAEVDNGLFFDICDVLRWDLNCPSGGLVVFGSEDSLAALGG